MLIMLQLYCKYEHILLPSQFSSVHKGDRSIDSGVEFKNWHFPQIALKGVKLGYMKSISQRLKPDQMKKSAIL